MTLPARTDSQLLTDFDEENLTITIHLDQQGFAFAKGESVLTDEGVAVRDHWLDKAVKITSDNQWVRSMQ